jgi:hypothetical protein
VRKLRVKCRSHVGGKLVLIINMGRAKTKIVKKPKTTFYKWTVILILGLAVVGFLFYFYGLKAEKFYETKIQIPIGKGKEFSINTSRPLKVLSQKVETLDPELFYIDSKNGFFFKKPENKNWSKPKFINGIFAFRQEIGFITHDDEFTKESLNNNLALLPWGPMVKEQEILRITYGEPIEIKITDKSKDINLRNGVRSILFA